MSTPHAVINPEPHRSPQDALPERSDGALVIVRSSTLPVNVAETRSEGERLAAVKDSAVLASSAQRILRLVFAKKEFREGQEEALVQVLQRRDSVVLLPTGAAARPLRRRPTSISASNSVAPKPGRPDVWQPAQRNGPGRYPGPFRYLGTLPQKMTVVKPPPTKLMVIV